jgi:L-ascorbate metabolism protein UlaG (beta-lactamase superfamily)
MWKSGRSRPAVSAMLLGAVLSACALRPSLEGYQTVPERTTPATGDALTVRFLGTSSLVLSDGKDTLVIDGFVTRPGALPVLLLPLKSKPKRVGPSLKRAGVDSVGAVLVAHTHYDHALDATAIARAFGATLYGSESLATIARAEGFPREVRRLDQIPAFGVGRFNVTAMPAPHSPDDLAPGAVAPDFRVPARARAWREGGSYVFRIEHGDCRILVVPSAGPAEAMPAMGRADVVLLGIGRLGRQSPQEIGRYWAATVKASGARLVIPIHWDDFTRSLDRPLVATPRLFDRVDVAMRELGVLAGEDVTIRLPRAFAPMDWSGLPAGRCRGATLTG